jgi:hypothetical protein
MSEIKKTDIQYDYKPNNSLELSLNELYHSIFNKSNIVLVIWFLIIYFIAYFILGFVFKKDNDSPYFQASLSKMIDFLILGFLFVFLFTLYFNVSDSDKYEYLTFSGKQITDFIQQPTSFISTICFIFVFYITIYLFRIPMEKNTKSVFVYIIETVIWLLLLVITIYDFFKYILLPDADTIDRYFDELIGKKPRPSTTPKTITGNIKIDGSNAGNTVSRSGNTVSSNNKEVFNISNNLYTYEDAQNICKAYDAELATYDQIEESYEDGAEWCNYGWSAKQMAFFPTQKDTWEKLQKTNGKNNCGRPGINGGYFDNPNIRFGVNCYGVKPKPSDTDLSRMHGKQFDILPKTSEDIELDSKIKFWKDNAAQLLELNSFNNYKWSEY